MRDDSHREQVERWAYFVRNNPKLWKKIHTEFIDGLFDKQSQVMERLLKTAEGKEKIVALYNIKNRRGYSGLL